MPKNIFNYLQVFLACFDLITMNGLFFLGYTFLDRIPQNSFFFTSYIHFGIILNLIWVSLSWAFRLYNKENISSFESFSRKSVRIYFVWFSGVMLYLFFSRQFQISRVFITTIVTGFGVMLIINRAFYLWIHNFFHHNKYFTKNVLILGYNNLTKKVIEYLEADTYGTNIIGFCDEHKNIKELTNYPIIGRIEGALKVSRDYDVDEIYSTISPEQDERIYYLMKEADQECIRFKIIPDPSKLTDHLQNFHYLKDLPILSRKEPLDDYGNELTKRIFDIIISFLSIVFILSWMIPLLGLLIFIESPGPIFFIQYRSGRKNKPFKCFKFRSMYVNKECDFKQATADDDRLTKVGKLIRKLSLDEFPQFLNVFKGDMSIVGPRPHMLKHTEDYSKQINQYMIRQFLKPGISGWAQVNGFRGETKTLDQMEQRVKHDLWYMENWSFWLDVRIIFLTILNGLKGEKNAF